MQTEDVSEIMIIDRPDTPAPLVGTTVIDEAHRAPTEPPLSQRQSLEGSITSTKDQGSKVFGPDDSRDEVVTSSAPVLLDADAVEPAQPLGGSHTAMEDVEPSAITQSAVSETQLQEEPAAVGDAGTSGAPAVTVDTTSATVTFALDEPTNAPPETHASPVITISAVHIASEDMPGSPTASSSPSEQALTPGNLPRPTSEEVEIVVEETADLPSPSLSIVKEVEESDIATSESESKIASSRPRIDKIASPVVRTTIAERRSMPIPGNASLSSPFNDRYSRKDPLPTGESGHGSTDADTEFGPKTGEINDNQSEHSIHEETREDLLRALIKAAQNQNGSGSPHLETDAIIRWNLEALPTKSERIPSDNVRPEKRLREYAWYLEKQQRHVATRVGLSIKRETEEERERVARLSAEYMQFNKEWREHCNFLDKLMEARPPPPAELYAVPGAYIPVVTPGIVPTTPSEESSRADRRRRGMASDAVSTEAQFQEILDQLADDASRDPKFRANKTAATVPDMFSPHEMRRRYEEENDLVLDPKVFYDFAGKAEPIWTSEERATFLKRYLANPKQFGKIAEGLADKTASDCVLYYYRTKKEVDYKSLLASRRGDKKRRAAPITKGGKGSALLSNLGRQKPIVDPRAAATPGRGRDDSTLPTSTIRRPKGARSEIRPLTPGHENLPKRPKTGDEEPESSAAASPIGSEMPAVAAPGKSKMRLTVRTNAKRPRITSISETPYSSTALVPPATLPDGTPGDPPGPLDPAELLPPVKRAGKRRKVDQADAATLPVEVNDKPKRNSTNSYWSVEDKKRFRDLVALHGADFALIASKLPNKSSRQVGNFYDAHKEEMGMGLDGIGPRVDAASTGEPTAAREPTVHAASPSTHPFGRSIYDVQGSARTSDPFERRQSSEPRMGVFNDRPHLVPPPLTTRLPPVQLPPPPSSAPRGGMSIMSLLNDAPSRPPPTREVDAVSDGTVSDRDAEGSASRPSPRSTVPLPVYPARYERRLSAGAYDRPDLDRYRSSSARPFAYDSSNTWTQRADPAQATGSLYPPPNVSSTTGPLVSSRSFPGPYDSSYPRTDPYARQMGPNEPYHSHYPEHTRPAPHPHPQYQQNPHPPPLPPPPIDRSNSQPTLPQHRQGFENHPPG
ncbi:hypothetical protein BCR39DRAFT_375919 [Naematelia encephala]|uniref:SANT domain-containing protein n=1 Tax=Naematelia encephala TaxID=71784 RepID=A0A1Y2BCP7_9TREE|nr:hypothetical protein BCR39DRAFT_375919 [Naematelia encephala]